MRDPALEYLDRRSRSLDRRSLLAPLSVSELLDNAARTYRALGTTILRETAVPMAMFYLVLVFAAEFVLPGLTQTKDPNSVAVQAGEVALALAISVFAALPLLLIALSYTSGLVSRLTADNLLGNVADLQSARAAARAGLGALVAVHVRVLITSVLLLAFSLALLLASAFLESSADAGLLVLFGMVASLGLGGCLLMAPIAISRYALAPSVVVIEGLRSTAAGRRAVALCRKSPPHPSGYDPFALIWLLVCTLVLVVWGGSSIGLEMFGVVDTIESVSKGSILGSAVLRFVELVPWFLAIWTVVPLWSTICTIHYFDRRVRLEGYDIELLEQDARRSLRTSRFEL